MQAISCQRCDQVAALPGRQHRRVGDVPVESLRIEVIGHVEDGDGRLSHLCWNERHEHVVKYSTLTLQPNGCNHAQLRVMGMITQRFNPDRRSLALGNAHVC